MLHRFWPLIAIVMFASVLVIAPTKAQEVSQENTVATQQVIDDQLKAFKKADHARAFSHAAQNIRQIFGDKDRFIFMVKKGYPAIYNSSSYVFGRNRLQSGAVFQEVLITDNEGTQWQAVYTLVDQDGEWKITGVQVNPNTGTAT